MRVMGKWLKTRLQKLKLNILRLTMSLRILNCMSIANGVGVV